ncbi:MAG: lysophospholipid acyltransferase family protein [Salaquimonas sp.]
MADMPEPDRVKQKAPRKRTPAWLRKPGRLVSQNRFFTPVVSFLAVHFLNLVYKTNSWVVEPENIIDQITPDLPVIVGVWHGQHILLPAIPIGLSASVMISRSLDGEITARVAESFGSRAIRASGGRDAKHTISKGALKGFLDMKAALERSENVLQTADIPKGTPRRVGRGIITLAQRSGRPIVLMAVASSRRLVLPKSWDRTTINLPFGKSAIVVGKIFTVPSDANDEEIETIRLKVQSELNRITRRAYTLCGKPEPETEEG